MPTSTKQPDISNNITLSHEDFGPIRLKINSGTPLVSLSDILRILNIKAHNERFVPIKTALHVVFKNGALPQIAFICWLTNQINARGLTF